MNVVILTGKFYPNERRGKVLPFAIKQSKKQKSGEYNHEYIDCKAFDSEYKQTAEQIEKYFKKGDVILITGVLAVETWERDGKKHRQTVVHLRTWEFPEKTSERSEGQGNLSW